jgi:hypothetical protein
MKYLLMLEFFIYSYGLSLAIVLLGFKKCKSAKEPQNTYNYFNQKIFSVGNIVSKQTKKNPKCKNMFFSEKNVNSQFLSKSTHPWNFIVA